MIAEDKDGQRGREIEYPLNGQTGESSDSGGAEVLRFLAEIGANSWALFVCQQNLANFGVPSVSL